MSDTKEAPYEAFGILLSSRNIRCHLEVADSHVFIKFVNLGKYTQLVYQQNLCKPLEKMPHYFLNDRANIIVQIVAAAIFFMVIIMLYCI